MHFAAVLASVLMGAAVTAQKVHVVSVADATNSLKYTPDNLKADVGDKVQFQFIAGNHTVTQSTFDQPCQPISMNSNITGIFSGFQPAAASAAQGKIPVFTISITDTKPMWLYCSQARHCQGGMTMVINENTAANASRSLAGFRALAKDAAVNLPGTAVNGGTATTAPSGSVTATGTGAAPTATKPTVNAASPVLIPTALSFLGLLAALLA